MKKEITTKGKGEWRHGFTTRRQVKALRKEYAPCCKCNNLIRKGSPAVRFAGIFEMQFFCVYAHLECVIEAEGSPDTP